jgi:DNA sulfur modification protein DndB
MPRVDVHALEIRQTNHSFWLTYLSATVLTQVSYAAVRGRDEEIGAVQRALNTHRIASLKTFALRGGDYPVTVVLNWLNPEGLELGPNALGFEAGDRIAQIIDGQHRIAGLAAAIDENPALGELSIPVAIYVGLTTQQCADIFLAINTEQKPAPKSLVYDLFGIAQKASVDVASLRARDIAISINESEGSPYYRELKMPGEKVRKGGVALSTAVAAIRPLAEPNGHFDRAGIKELEIQQAVVLNYLGALREEFGTYWESKDNALKYASGFTGAMQFFANRIIPYCKEQKSFKLNVIRHIIDFAFTGPILQSELKGLGGAQAVNKVYERMDEALNLPSDHDDIYEF